MQTAKTDQTGRIPRLIWVFAGRTVTFFGFVMSRLIWVLPIKSIIIYLRFCYVGQLTHYGIFPSLYQLWTSLIYRYNFSSVMLENYMSRGAWQNQQNDVLPAKTQISMDIRPVWTESLLSTLRKTWPLTTYWAHSEDWSDWADAQADLSLLGACHFVGVVVRRLTWFYLSHIMR